MAAEIGPAAQIGVASIAALRYAQSDGYDVIVPVRPAQAVHASFRHIQVLPDTRVQNGVPLYKLKILDTLIDKLSPGDARGPSRPAAAIGGKAAESIDALLGDLSKGLRANETAAARGAGSSAYRAGLLPLPGAFVDLVA